MKYSIRKVFFLFTFFIISLSVFFVITVMRQFNNEILEEKAGYINVTLNEIKHLTDDISNNEENKELKKQLNKIVESNSIQELIKSTDLEHVGNKMILYILTVGIIMLIFLILLFMYLYKRIIRPFENLEDFAKSIAVGRFDISLNMERKNIFGEFTKAFDIMRNELKMSKEREKESNDAKKTLIATLSHDIKTPVASIRAYAEGLSSGMNVTEERKEKYLNVIINKADEITKLTNDLFLHAISDMEKMVFNSKEYNSKEVLEEILFPLFIQYDNKLKVIQAFPQERIFTDKLRLVQVFNNIISNSAKYAKDSDIIVSFSENEEYLECIFKDYGNGVLPEDMPFLFDKFYRGKNTDILKIPGTGLGLYIVKYIMGKTNGYVKAKTLNGFEVTIGIKKI